MEHEIRGECRTWRDSIEHRMKKVEDMGETVTSDVSDHRTDIRELKTDMKHLTKSIQGQTKAIWGMVAMVMTALIGFFIWYVQGLQR